MPAPDPEPAVPPTILSYVYDLPNLCSLAGLGCTVAAIYACLIGMYEAAMIGMVWAVAFDWADGLIARRMPGRTDSDRSFGAQLDVSIDIVSYGGFDVVFLPGAFLMLAAAAIRLSYFSTFGLSENAQYTGLALDNNSLVLVLAFAFEGMLGAQTFPIVLYAICLALAALNVSQIQTPKLSGNPNNVRLLALYTCVMTALYSWKLS